MVKMKLNQIYSITWIDHFFTEGWFDNPPNDLYEKIGFTTVGFYVKSNKDYHFVAMTHGTTNYGEIMSILKSSITEIKELK